MAALCQRDRSGSKQRKLEEAAPIEIIQRDGNENPIKLHPKINQKI